MTQDTLIIFASSRSDGHTKKAIDSLFDSNTPLVDLGTQNISYFDYESKNIKDDFIPLVEKLVGYKNLVFATPTYWYSMSAQMKTFFDRISDLYFHRKDLLEGLKKKNVFVVTSFGSSMDLSFEEAFRLSSKYLQMNYQICHYDYSGKDPELTKSSRESKQKFLAKFKELKSQQ